MNTLRPFLVAWLVGCAPPAPPIIAPEVTVEASPEPEREVLPEVAIEPLPITWNTEREALTVAYRAEHQASSPGTATIDPSVVVLHWTAGESIDGAFAVFDPPRLQGRPELAGASALNVSAHFLVGQDGTIHQLLPTTTMARHVIGLNHVAIGIENIGGTAGMPLTTEQVRANADLVRHLMDEHDISWLIGHHEYRQMEGTPLWDERDATYRTTKVDPGESFVHAVHERVASGRLQRAPSDARAGATTPSGGG